MCISFDTDCISLYLSLQTNSASKSISGGLAKLRRAGTYFIDPVLVVLCLAGAIRNGAGIVWAFNNVPFFDKYHPGTKVNSGLVRFNNGQ